MMVLEFLLLPLRPLVLGRLGWEAAGWSRPLLAALLKSLDRLLQPPGRVVKSPGRVRLLQSLCRLPKSPGRLLRPPSQIRLLQEEPVRRWTRILEKA